MRYIVAATAVALALGLSACGATPPGRADAPPTSQPVQTPVATPSAAPTPSATPVHTTTPTPSAVPTPSVAPAPATATLPAGDPLVHLVAVTRPMMAALLKQQPAYADIQVNAVPPSTLEYRYVYAERQPVTPAEAAAYFEAMVPTLQTAVDTQVFPAMLKAGVHSPRVTYTYVNPDGSVLWTRTFDPS